MEGRLAHIYYVKSRGDRGDEINGAAKFAPPAAPVALYQRFLLYKYFVANPRPTIITEGRSDIIYLTAAIKALASKVPALITKNNGKAVPNVTFLRHTRNNGRILNLAAGLAASPSSLTCTNIKCSLIFTDQ